MKVIKYLFPLVLILIAIGCSSDNNSPDGPLVTFLEQDSHTANNDELDPSTSFEVKVKGESNRDIKAITFTLNGSNITSSDITIDGEEAESNPYFIPLRTNEIEFTIGLISPDVPGQYTYNFTITDIDNATGGIDLVITVK